MAKKKTSRKRTRGNGPPLPLDAIDHMMLAHTIKTPALTAVELGLLVGLASRAIKMRWGRPEYTTALKELSKPAREILEKVAADGARELGRQIDFKPKDFKNKKDLDQRHLDIKAAKIRQGAALGVVRTVEGDKTVHDGNINTKLGLTPEQIADLGKQILKESRKR